MAGDQNDDLSNYKPDELEPTLDGGQRPTLAALQRRGVLGSKDLYTGASTSQDQDFDSGLGSSGKSRSFDNVMKRG